MFWKKTQKGQGPEHVVTEFLKRFSTVKPKDRETKQYTFWQKAYPNLFTVKRQRLASGKEVIVFYPIKDEEVEDAQEGITDEPEQAQNLEGPPGQPRLRAGGFADRARGQPKPRPAPPAPAPPAPPTPSTSTSSSSSSSTPTPVPVTPSEPETVAPPDVGLAPIPEEPEELSREEQLMNVPLGSLADLYRPQDFDGMTREEEIAELESRLRQLNDERNLERFKAGGKHYVVYGGLRYERSDWNAFVKFIARMIRELHGEVVKRPEEENQRAKERKQAREETGVAEADAAFSLYLQQVFPEKNTAKEYYGRFVAVETYRKKQNLPNPTSSAEWKALVVKYTDAELQALDTEEKKKKRNSMYNALWKHLEGFKAGKEPTPKKAPTTPGASSAPATPGPATPGAKSAPATPGPSTPGKAAPSTPGAKPAPSTPAKAKGPAAKASAQSPAVAKAEPSAPPPKAAAPKAEAKAEPKAEAKAEPAMPKSFLTQIQAATEEDTQALIARAPTLSVANLADLIKKLEDRLKNNQRSIVENKRYSPELQKKILEGFRKALQDKKKQAAEKAASAKAASGPSSGAASSSSSSSKPPPPQPPKPPPPKAVTTPKPSAPPPHAQPTRADFDHYGIYNPQAGWPYGLFFDRNNEYGAGRFWWLRDRRYNRWVLFEDKHKQ